MNEYFTSLRAIAQSSTELLADQYHSINSSEIKQSAKALRSSIQPCLDNLLQAQVQLKRNLMGCMKTLEQSEAVLQSKQQVIKTSNLTILERLGEISGCWNRIQQLAAEQKVEVIAQAKQKWYQQIEELKEGCFLNTQTKQYREGIGWGEKDKFRRDLPGKVASVSENLDSEIKEVLNHLLQALDTKHLNSAQSFVDLFDPKLKFQLTKRKEDILTEVEDGFDRHLDTLSDSHTVNLSQGLHYKIEEWRQRFGDISWEEVAKFRDEGLTKIEQRVEMVISDRLAMLQKVVKWALTFYNYFLNIQKRYQQETPEQRAAEKAWIDQQRQQLKQLLASIELSLK
ncbi:hypothetical protein [Phormidesmis sp. 146-33]